MISFLRHGSARVAAIVAAAAMPAARTGAAVLLAGMAFADTARAADESPDAMELHLGQQQFSRYCSTCHGPGAEGDGVASSLFKKTPPNLTLLSQRNDGVFPEEKVLAVVKGESPIAAHGEREMPVWGEILDLPNETTVETETISDSKLTSVVYYLRSVQKK